MGERSGDSVPRILSFLLVSVPTCRGQKLEWHAVNQQGEDLRAKEQKGCIDLFLLIDHTVRRAEDAVREGLEQGDPEGEESGLADKDVLQVAKADFAAVHRALKDNLVNGFYIACIEGVHDAFCGEEAIGTHFADRHSLQHVCLGEPRRATSEGPPRQADVGQRIHFFALLPNRAGDSSEQGHTSE